MKLKNDFEYFLQTRFDEMGTYGETPITKDNCENLYEIWSSQLDIQELIDYADEFGAKLAQDIIDNISLVPKSERWGDEFSRVRGEAIGYNEATKELNDFKKVLKAKYLKE